MRKEKSFIQSFTWVGVMLLFMGAIFLTVAIVMQIVPMSPDNMHVEVNGVPQAATEGTVRTFRLIFLLVFGIVGLVLAIPGVVIMGRRGRQRKLAQRLKREGIRVKAEVTDYVQSSATINNRPMERLCCAYTDADNRIYVFKSGILRLDPVPYLKDGLVDVYYDRNDVRRYYVDVDGSVGMGTNYIEL